MDDKLAMLVTRRAKRQHEDYFSSRSCSKYRAITVETLITNLLIANITQPKRYTNKALGPLGHARLVRYLVWLLISIEFIIL